MNQPPFQPFAPLAATADEALTEIFGFPRFREGQREVIDAVIAGKDSVVVMPTGSGKSLCYMLPACVMPGLVVVVSPLIALMKDQADALEAFGVPATFINSSLSWPEQQERLAALRAGVFKILLVAPERFKSQVFMDAVSELPVGLFAIDEAHCISSWGHDFRPDYLTLDKAREALGKPTTIALTATATPQVQTDIARQLGLEDAQIVVSGFQRPNLFFEVYSARSQREKYDRMLAAIEMVEEGSTVIYCATRKQVEQVSRKLEQAGLHPAMYHAGLGDAQREEVQDAFMNSDAPVLVATNAFGMGVDKSDVRLIVHFNLPGSVEAYYQEAGRAGRDSEPAHCLLLYNRNDRGIHEFFTDNSFPPRELLERLWLLLQKHGPGTHALSEEMLADHLSRGGSDRVHPWAVGSALRLLVRGGHVAFGNRQGMPWIDVIDAARSRDLRVDWEELKQRRQIAEKHLDQMSRYATGGYCRQKYLIRYFSRAYEDAPDCKNCDACCGPPAYGAKPQQKILVADEPEMLVKKLLSGVARTRARWGTHVVAAMLRGSAAKKVTGAGLDKLSTYGLLSALRQTDLVFLLDLLNQLGLVGQDHHGCLKLTDAGMEVMKSKDGLPEHVASTFLRHVTTDASTVSPVTKSDLRGFSKKTGRTGELGDTYLHTLMLRQKGHGLDEIVELRGLTRSSVLRHFIALASEGHDLNLDASKNEAILSKLREIAAEWNVGDPLAPLKEQLPDSCDYATLKINLAILLAERHANAGHDTADRASAE